MIFPLSVLPTLNAALNGATFLLLLGGYYFIRQKKINLHRACMIAAVSISVLFLVSYLIYHSQVGSVKFVKEGWVRPVYFSILISHTILAVTILPLAALTAYRGLSRKLVAHVKIARWTLPLWIYVSITGVLIYLMLYHL